MTTPSTGAPQPRDTGKTEQLPDPVEAIEAEEGEPTPEQRDQYREVGVEDQPGGD